MNTYVVKAIAVDKLVESRTLAKSQLEERHLEKDGEADKSTKPYERICRFQEARNVTLFNKKKYKVSISVRAVAIKMYLVNCVLDSGAGPNLISKKCIRQ